MKKKIYLIVLDSVGLGEALDAKKFNDIGADTLGNLSKYYNLKLPNLEKFGLGNLREFKTIHKNSNPIAYHTYMMPKSAGKDSIAGHWEIMGCTIKEPFNIYIKNGFPTDLICEFEKLTGRKVLGNKEANGLKIIHELGMKQKETRDLIVYTSIDSTFQIAAHEEWIGLEELYKSCEIARKLTNENKDWLVARVIARPFIGDNNKFIRTGNRHDYALDPFEKTILEYIKEENYDVISIGKINDLYNGKGITKSIPTKNNEDGIEKLIDVIKNNDFNGLVFLNLVDFDSMYGHPRKPKEYKESLEYFDKRLPEIINNLNDNDICFITSDHGNDPTYKGNDHTRENVPLLIYSKKFNNCKFIKPREQFSDLGRTIADLLGVKVNIGKSFIEEIENIYD